MAMGFDLHFWGPVHMGGTRLGSENHLEVGNVRLLKLPLLILVMGWGLAFRFVYEHVIQPGRDIFFDH